MPFVLLVVALALNLFLWRRNGKAERRKRRRDEGMIGEGGVGSTSLAYAIRNTQSVIRDLLDLIPLRMPGLLLLVVVAGGLIFLNTWDFPPYWLLLTLCVLWVARRAYGVGRAVWLAVGLAATLLIGALVV